MEQVAMPKLGQSMDDAITEQIGRSNVVLRRYSLLQSELIAIQEELERRASSGVTRRPGGGKRWISPLRRPFS